MLIKVNTNLLKNKAEKIKSTMENYSTAVKGINSKSTEMGNIWKDNNYSYYIGQINVFLDELGLVENVLNSYANFMEGYAQAMDEIDTQFGSKNIDIK